MRESAINLKAHEVRAILDGRKTQKRVVVKLPHQNHLGVWEPMSVGGPEGGRTAQGKTAPMQGAIWHTRTGDCLLCPLGQPGDRLWVKEATRSRYLPNILTGDPTDALCGEYAADSEPVLDAHDFDLSWWYSRDVCPSIHMPRWASRITLEITGVRAEKLQSISEKDALAEGIQQCEGGAMDYLANDYAQGFSPKSSFRSLWESINGPGSWTANPYVWVIEFRRIEGAQA